MCKITNRMCRHKKQRRIQYEKIKQKRFYYRLVIVIAVIAILAAVLIPTFSGIVEKNNKSAALQGARNAVALMEVEEDAQVPNGTYYITFENGELKPNSITDVVPETLGGRLYEHNDQFNSVEIYKVGVINFSLRRDTPDETYNGNNGSNYTISLNANNELTITVNGELVKTTSSEQSQGKEPHYLVGITLPTGLTYGEDYPLTEQDHWLYIRTEEVINAPKTFKVNSVVYTCKVVLGTSGSFA